MEKISYVIPVFDEEDNIVKLFEEITAVSKIVGKEYEIIFVDDCSRDNSLNVIKDLASKMDAVKYVAFENNTGQSAAMYAGFQYASGDVVITMDADLQNDPADIPEMLKFYGEYDMVIGWRYNRKDTLAKKIASRFGNKIRNSIIKDNVHDTGCSLKIMRSSMLKKIKIYKGLHRFLPAMMQMEGAMVKEVKVNHRPRIHGVSKYTNMKRAKEALYDLISVRWMQKRYLKIEVRETNVAR
ncbi:glycosyl transferase family 2 [Denitrovibrio acetiphilus DSM 12809]|uniref:Glycosyl transferase family 2 n=1 Tax=Denitrovibrio acetiphilus (strain DSM 12809 / NBRC 114555 / N2460) TaxID=522772 RepID=D4H0Y1_DENA2|nr:glycosyltransferase family 2 protein [Denitrovibrio acetiphilus]ADD68644.1 glycosyl transferase family 2 [Denitrovibrio acetiphilus DSM 12809]